MIRQFSLEEISFEAFNELCKGMDKPAESSELTRSGLKKRYFKVQDHVTYPDLSQLLWNMEDDSQYPVCAWFPKGDIGIGEAIRRAVADRFGHYAAVARQGDNHSKIVVRVSPEPGRKSQEDAFEFRRENGLWVLRYFHIKRDSLPFYTFHGVGDLRSLRVGISAIHAYNQVL